MKLLVAFLICLFSLSTPAWATTYYYSGGQETYLHLHNYGTGPLGDWGENIRLGEGFLLAEVDTDAMAVSLVALLTAPEKPYCLGSNAYCSNSTAPTAMGHPMALAAVMNTRYDLPIDPDTGAFLSSWNRPADLNMLVLDFSLVTMTASLTMQANNLVLTLSSPLSAYGSDGLRYETYLYAPLNYLGSTPVPEPGSLLLMSCAGLALLRNRRRG